MGIFMVKGVPSSQAFGTCTGFSCAAASVGSSKHTKKVKRKQFFILQMFVFALTQKRRVNFKSESFLAIAYNKKCAESRNLFLTRGTTTNPIKPISKYNPAFLYVHSTYIETEVILLFNLKMVVFRVRRVLLIK